MIIKYNHLALLTCIGFLSCASSQNKTDLRDTLTASALLPYGRTKMTNNQQLELISSAAHFGFSFEGNSCEIYASIPDANGHSYLQYEIDSVYQKRVRIDGNSKESIVVTAAGAGKHTIWIYKATEAHTGPILIEKIVSNGIKPLQNSKAPLIEFIGNSITCGAAADDSEVDCGEGEYHDQHNAYKAYGPRVARALKTNFIVSGVSGIGIYRNWNSDGPTMPQVYENTDFQNQNTQRWNFNLYSPKIVSIALGTNDFSSGDGKKQRLAFDSAAYVNNYIKFLQLVKSKYPDAQVALLSSAMVTGSNRITLQNCLSAVKNSIDALYPSNKPVALYFFKPMQARGCTGHPSVEDHAILAEELIPFFKKYL